MVALWIPPEGIAKHAQNGIRCHAGWVFERDRSGNVEFLGHRFTRTRVLSVGWTTTSIENLRLMLYSHHNHGQVDVVADVI